MAWTLNVLPGRVLQNRRVVSFLGSDSVCRTRLDPKPVRPTPRRATAQEARCVAADRLEVAAIFRAEFDFRVEIDKSAQHKATYD
jgi:hypothetical protein